jgi:tight adherence protein C
VNPLLLLTGALLWAGLTLLLSELRWFSRRSLVERLGPYVPGGMGVRTRAGVLSVESFREAVGPLARLLGGQFSRVFGVTEDLDRRLTRIHSSLDVTEFRVRQIGWAIAGFGVGSLATVAFRPPVVVALLLMLGGMPCWRSSLLEQQVSGASDRWKRSVYLELPSWPSRSACCSGPGSPWRPRSTGSPAGGAGRPRRTSGGSSAASARA